MKTYTPKLNEIERRWWVVDAEGKPLGRLATEIARILRGKHKPMYTPHLDTGDNVVVIRALNGWNNRVQVGQPGLETEVLEEFYQTALGRHVVQGPDRIVVAGERTAEMRDGDTFKDPTTPPAGATHIERVAAFSGRTV